MTPEEAAAKAAESPSFLGQTLAWVAAAIAGIGAWLWTNTMGRIQRLEQSKVDKDDFAEYVKRADKDRDERRDAEIKIFDKLDNLKDLFHDAIRK